jgi:hypothetical protein
MDAAVLGARHRFERRRRALSVCLGPGSQPHRLLTIAGILPLLTVAPGGKPSPRPEFEGPGGFDGPLPG